MAKITHVKSAQQRYETVPVLNPDGTQKQTPVMKNGVQRKDKRGNPIFMNVTVADKTKPLPPRQCGSCGEEIAIGTPYKHISPRSGPYGGRTLYRHEDCPTWHVWEYSSSLSARTAEISHDFWNDFNENVLEEQDQVQDILNSAAERVRELAEEKRESASNIEDGFGHETQMSSELNDIADQLDSWADDIENADLPDFPEPEEQDCDNCDGGGEVDNEEYETLQEEILKLTRQIEEEKRGLKVLTSLPADMQLPDNIAKIQEKIKVLEKQVEDKVAVLENMDSIISCEECEGSGKVEPDAPTEEQMDEWRSECESAVSVIDECPV